MKTHPAFLNGSVHKLIKIRIRWRGKSVDPHLSGAYIPLKTSYIYTDSSDRNFGPTNLRRVHKSVPAPSSMLYDDTHVKMYYDIGTQRCTMHRHRLKAKSDS